MLTPATHPGEETIEFTAEDGLRRRGFLCSPGAGSWPAPVVVILHGLAGPGEPVGRPVMPDVVGELLAHRIGALRFLPRVVELPRELAAGVDWEAELADFAGALRFAQRLGWVDVDQVYLLGLSLGGLAAPVVAGRVGGVAGLASFGSGARPWRVYEPSNLRAQLTHAGREAAFIERWSAVLEKWLELLEETELTAEQVLADAPELARLGVTSSGYHGRSLAFWRQLVRFDPASSYRGLTCPILAIRGGDDRSCHVEDVEAIVAAARAAGLEVAATTLPGIDHGLRPAEGAEADGRPLARCVAEWVLARSGRAAPLYESSSR